MENDQEQRRVSRALFVAVVFVFGLQSMRFLFASLTWYLRDTVGIGVLDLIPIAFAPFLLAALFPALSRWFGVRVMLIVALSLLILARLANQVSGDPALDFWFASVSTCAFVGTVPFLFSLGRTALASGLLVGLAIDSAIKGLGLSLDLAYQPGWRPIVAVAALSLALIWAYGSLGGIARHGVSWSGGVGLLGLAPLLFVEMLLFQSQGWTSAATGISGPTAQLRIAVLNAIAVYLAWRLSSSRIALAVSLLITLAAIFAAEGGETAYNVLSLLAVPAAGVLWSGMVPEPDSDRIGVSSFYLVGALAIFLVFGLAYYVPLDMNIGFDASAVRIVAGLLLGLLGLVAVFRSSTLAPIGRYDWVFAAGAAVLPLVAFAGAIATDVESKVEADGPVRFMSYNIHSAFNPDGAFDVAAIARVIDDTRPDIVALQEVPRGRLLSANTDVLTLLSLELGFEHVAFFGTTDPVWGNAILSRYPILGQETDYLPRVGTPMRRGYLGATISTGDDEVLVISTHLQHVNDSSVHDEDPEADLLPVHTEQIGAILDDWAGITPAVLMGDFNARPDWAQIALLTTAGWVDTWEEAGTGSGLTSNSVNPMHRIDYIFHSPGLIAVDAGVIQSTASDHLPVVADLSFE